jgi:hypothetical protein
LRVKDGGREAANLAFTEEYGLRKSELMRIEIEKTSFMPCVWLTRGLRHVVSFYLGDGSEINEQ